MKIIKKLITDAGEIPLSDVDFTLSFALVDADDLSARDSFKSSTIAIPLTPAVASIFNRFQKVEFPEPENMRGVLQIENLFLRGDVIIHGTERIMDVEVINVQVVANGFFERLAGLSLREAIPSFFIDKTVINVLALNEEIQDLIFIPVDHGNIYELNDLKLVELHPIFSCYYAMRYVVESAGYTLNSESFPLYDFRDFILDFQNLLQNEVDFHKERNATADKTISIVDEYINPGSSSVTQYLTAAGILESYSAGDISKKVEWGNVEHKGDMFSSTNSRYNIDKTGSYRIMVQANVVATCIISVGTIVDAPEFSLLIKKNGNTITAFTDSVIMPFFSGSGTVNNILEFNTSFMQFNKHDYLEVYYEILGEASVGDSGVLTWNVSLEFDLQIEADPRFGINSLIDQKNHVPDWSAAHFLKNYFTLRNLVCEVNEEKKEVLILQKKNYYNGAIIDFTNRIIKTKKIEVAKYNKPAKLTFEYTEDGNDITFITGTNKEVHEFSNTRNPEQVLKVDFAKTKMVHFLAAGISGNLNESTPYILNELPDYDNFRHLKYNFKQRILRNYGHIQSPPQGTLEGESWDDFFPEMRDVSPLEFKAEYAQDIKEMQWAKVMKCSAMIKPHEINSLIVGGTFTLRNLVRVGVNVYKILKIEGWNIDNNVARLILLQNV